MNQKITVFLPSLEIGGAERNVVNLLNYFSNDKKLQVSLLLGYKKGDFLKKIPFDIKIIELKTTNSFIIFFKFIKFLKKEEPDIFVSNFPRFNAVILLAKSFISVKTKVVIIEHTLLSFLANTASGIFHQIIVYLFFPYLMKFLYPKADAIICVSQLVADDIRKFIGDSSKIKIIHNPVLGEEIFKLSKEEVNHFVFKNQKVPIILTIGRLSQVKDYPTLLLAFSQVLQKKEANLVILGDGPQRKYLERLSQRLNIEKNVYFLGFQDNPYKFLSKASVFVLSSSLREGFGNVIIEAMACGIPVISTNSAGPSEIIENKKNGILVKIKDEKALSEAILTVLTNKVLAKELVENGKIRAYDFTIKKSAESYIKLFQELLKND